MKEWAHSGGNVAQQTNSPDKIRTVNLTCPRRPPSAETGRKPHTWTSSVRVRV